MLLKSDFFCIPDKSDSTKPSLSKEAYNTFISPLVNTFFSDDNKYINLSRYSTYFDLNSFDAFSVSGPNFPSTPHFGNKNPKNCNEV